jgi:hypothetical protein
MKTILKVLNLAALARTESEIVELTDHQAERCIDSGDRLGAGASRDGVKWSLATRGLTAERATLRFI